MDYQKTAKELTKLLGGKENVIRCYALCNKTQIGGEK
ncbi:hypothetical protein BSAF29S_03133 [Bacillus safensis subsp. safensis]